MKKILLAGSLAAVMAMAGCAQPTGTVSEKEIEVTTRKRKIKTCNELTILKADGAEAEICVSKSEYDKYNVGDKYP